eukprot:COSAG02_NODE_13865_length_1337_cov_4.739095_1_plen_315_part_01
MVIAVVAASVIVVCCGGCSLAKRAVFASLQSRATGELRRALRPPGSPRTGAEEVNVVPVEDAQLKVSTDYYTLQRATIAGEQGGKLFYTCILPAQSEVESVIVFFHGFGDHHDFLLMNIMRAYAVRFSAVVLGVDMPGHGRSDGLWVHIPDWLEFVEAGEEFVERVARPKCTELAAPGNAPLKLFAQGVSMGGGVCATMALTRPDLLHGLILEAPMLTVSDDIKPPWLIQMLFKHLIVRLLPLWPVAPTKDLLDRCFSNPRVLEVVRANRETLGLGYQYKPRLKTAKALGFDCPDFLTPRLKDIRLPFFCMHGAA